MTIADLLLLAAEIKNETVAKANTAMRVGKMLEKIINNFPYQSEVVVDISSPQILAIGTTPIELLPTLAAGQYYDFKIITEYTYGTVAYTNSDANWLVLTDGGTQKLAPLLNLNGITGNRVNISTHNSNNFEVLVSAIEPTHGIYLTTAAAGNPTLGDGTIKVKISYTIKTFG